MVEKQKEIAEYTTLILNDVLPILESTATIRKDFTVSEENLLSDETIIAIANNVENELKNHGYIATTRTVPHCGLIKVDVKR